MALDGCMRVFFFRGVTSFIRLKAMSLCKSVQGGGRERGGKVGGGEYIDGSRDWKDFRVVADASSPGRVFQ